MPTETIRSQQTALGGSLMGTMDQQSDVLAVTISAQVGDKTYPLGSAAVATVDEAMLRLPALLQDIAIALIAAAS